MKCSDIELFTKSSSGTGRDENDKRNSLREAILSDGFNGKTAEFFDDPVYGQAWKDLDKAFREAVESLGGEGPVTVKRMGGRKHNYDFLVRRSEDHKVEFKFGGLSVDSLPEYFNPSADKPFHSTVYASFFYHNYLPQIAALCGVDLPSEDVYLKAIHKNSSKLEFFNALKKCEDDPEKAKQKSRIVNESIAAFLEKERESTNLKALTEEFQRSQSGKKFMIYNSGKFYHDKIEETELIATGVKEIRNGNVLVINSANPKTEHHMLLRWKNHKGVLFPAWQISMRRAK
jgi:hypothetical protein